MPTASKTPCKGCGRATQGRLCDVCREKGLGREQRLTAAKRGYDWTWKRFRRAYLDMHPLCVDCQAHGRVNLARHVHHKARLKEHPELKYVESNLLGLCESHHDARTALGE